MTDFFTALAVMAVTTAIATLTWWNAHRSATVAYLSLELDERVVALEKCAGERDELRAEVQTLSASLTLYASGEMMALEIARLRDAIQAARDEWLAEKLILEEQLKQCREEMCQMRKRMGRALYDDQK